ncbi:MAG: FAD-dependent monooxygenase, partial [Pseudomonadota bacterium]
HMTGGAADGPFDLVVDSAGARSTLSPLQGRPLPYGAIWGTVDWPDTDLPPNQLTQVYRRADRMIGVLPIGCMPGDDGPKAAIFWSLPQDDHKQWQDTGVTAWSKAATEL